VGRLPIELGPSLGGDGPLIEEQDFGEGVTQTCSGLIVGSGHCPGRDRRDCGRLRQFGNGRARSVADDESAVRGVVFQDAREEIGEVGNVHRRPVLLSRAEHDQVSVVVARRTEEDPGSSSSAVPIGGTGHDDDSAHLFLAEHAAFDRFLPCHKRRRIERGLLADSKIVPVDPQTADVDVGLPVPAKASTSPR